MNDMFCVVISGQIFINKIIEIGGVRQAKIVKNPYCISTFSTYNTVYCKQLIKRYTYGTFVSYLEHYYLVTVGITSRKVNKQLQREQATPRPVITTPFD